MVKPRLLDLFCGAGGCSGPKDCSTGYSKYFDCTGVDLYPQKRYPHKFIQANALGYLQDHWSEYDFIHTSPPCKKFTRMMSIRLDSQDQRDKHQDLVTPVREILISTSKPFIIENTTQAILINPITLCGTMFNLKVLRHRYFESNVILVAPKHYPHIGTVQDGDFIGVYGTGGAMMRDDGKGRRKDSKKIADMRSAMGIDWMIRKEITQSIPPAFTEYLSLQLLNKKQQMRLLND